MTAPLSLGEEIATFLQDQSLTTDLNYDGAGDINLFVSMLPDMPVVAAAVIERAGVGPMQTLTGSGAAMSRLDRPRIQIRVRSGMGQGQYKVGEELAQSIYWTLQAVTEQRITTAGQWFHMICAVSAPQYLGRDADDRERQQWSQGFDVWFDNAAAA